MEVIKNKKFILVRELILACILISFAWFKIEKENTISSQSKFEEASLSSFQHKTDLLEKIKLNITPLLISQNTDSIFKTISDYEYKSLNDENAGIYIFKKDSLKFWSNNTLNVSLNQLSHKNNWACTKLLDGWYLLRKTKIDVFTCVEYIKIKNEFRVQNNYLENTYLLIDDFSDNISISTTTKNKQLIDKNGKTLFSYTIDFNHEKKNNDILSFIAFIIGIFFLLRTIQLAIEIFIHSKIIGFLLVSTLFILARYYSIVSELPWFWKSHYLFKPLTFASSSINSSLGDLLLNLILAFAISNRINAMVAAIKLRLPSWIQFMIGIAISICAGFIFSYYTGILVTDSNINFNFSDISELNQETFIAIGAIAILSYIVFYVLQYGIRNSIENFSGREIYVLVFSLLLIWVILLYNQYNIASSVFFYTAAFYTVFYIYSRAHVNNSIYSISVFTITIFATWTSIIINYQLMSKKEAQAKILAEKVSVEKDILAENLFSETDEKIKKDTTLLNYLYRPDRLKTLFLKRMSEKYFNGYWDKFATKVYIYDVACNLIAKTANANEEKLAVFEEVCSKHELQSTAKNLYYVPRENDEDAGLLCKINFEKIINGRQIPITVFIQFTNKYNADEIGFPSLLIDNKYLRNSEKFSEFSYAKYRNTLLIPLSKNNLYNYPLSESFIKNKAIQQQLLLTDGYFNYEGFRHYYYKPYKNVAFITSFKNYTFLEKMTTSAYVFAVFVFLFLIYHVIINFSLKNLPKFNTINIKFRTILIVTVFSGITIIAITTSYFLMNHLDTDKKTKMSENVQSLMIELENKFGDETILQSKNAEYYNYLLSKTANLFFNDINLYDLRGKLIASSRYKIFDEGILSPYINSKAYHALIINKDAQFINEESVGKLQYISIYIPFVNTKNQLLGYVHLPMFDKEKNIRKEIFNLLATILNIYLILLVFISIAAWWMTNKITEPLLVLKNHFAEIALRKNNTVIEWQTDDEIGSVVKEYNNMVLQLNENVEKLSQTEREMAWREMAKQVAHEIKNPLTPMKLNVQLLQQKIDLDEKQFKDRFIKVSKSLIEQIDSLANIANDFSMFAQITKNKPSKIDVIELLENIISMFQSENDAAINMNTNAAKIYLYADRDHLIRVFNNLIKNAIQSYEENESKEVQINVILHDNHLQIEIKDLGKGIPEEVKDKIFQPYFTTKNSGTGLGLAMVHQMVESMKGEISFKNNQPKGTIFKLTFNNIN
jgi:signal transduction histidine kinase